MATNEIPQAEEMTIRQAYELIYRPNLVQASPKTLQGYRTTVNSWERFTDDPPVAKITNRTLTQFRDAVLQAGLAPSTFNKEWRGIRAILRRLGPQEYRNPLGEGILANIPYVEALREDRDYPRIATEAELNSLYATCDEQTWPKGSCPALWWRTLIVVAFQTGARSGDLRKRFTAENFDLEAMEVRWRAGKTNKRQTVPLHDATAEHIRELIADRPGLFDCAQNKKTIYRHWGCLQDAAGIKPHFGFHCLRKTAATLYEQAVPGSARFILGHSLRGVTDQYYINPVAIMTEAVEKLDMPQAFLRGAGSARKPPPFIADDWAFSPDGVKHRARPLRLGLRQQRVLYAIVVSGGVAGFDEIRAVAFGETFHRRDDSTIKSTVSQLRDRLRSLFDLYPKFDPLPWNDDRNGWSIAIP